MGDYLGSILAEAVSSVKSPKLLISKVKIQNRTLDVHPDVQIASTLRKLKIPPVRGYKNSEESPSFHSETSMLDVLVAAATELVRAGLKAAARALAEMLS